MPMENKRRGDRFYREKSRRSEPVDLSPTVLYSAEAEKAVLGCMLAQPAEVIDEARGSLAADDFFIPAHQEIFDSICGMEENRIAIDVMTVHQWLKDRRLDEAVGSPGILAEMLVDFATHLNVGSYIQIVKEKSQLRRLQLACTTIVQGIAEMPDSVPSVLDLAEKEIMSVTQGTTASDDLIPTGRMMAEVVRKVTTDAGRRPVVGIHTGFGFLNEYTGGWRAGEMIVLAARPGIGKTSLALAFAHEAARYRWSEEKDDWVAPGVPVGIISIEMPHEQLMYKRLSMRSGVPLQNLRQGLKDERDMQQVAAAAADMADWPIHVMDPSSCMLSQCRAKSRILKKKYGIQLLVIDYLQLISNPSSRGPREDRQNEVAEISRGIKALAKELRIPVIILAQLNRKTDDIKRSRPALHHLRESGAIEQDADTVLLLSYDEVDGEEPDKTAPVIKVTCDIAKQRNGPCRDVSMEFHRRYTKFCEPTRGLV